MGEPVRLDPEREAVLRKGAAVKATDRGQLLGEIDYLREQLAAETHHATTLRRMLPGGVLVHGNRIEAPAAAGVRVNPESDGA